MKTMRRKSLGVGESSFSLSDRFSSVALIMDNTLSNGVYNGAVTTYIPQITTTFFRQLSL